MNRIALFTCLVCFALSWTGFLRAAEDKESLFSGPQVGEKLLPFKVLGVFDEAAGKEIDFVAKAGDKPIVLIFVHDLNRPSISMTRILSGYTLTRAKDGLSTGVVWLDDDLTNGENSLKRIRHALTPNAPIGVSVDGREGPGSYGLNRNVTLTILVGNAGKVTANFPLIQPSIQADLPKILSEIVKQVGGPIPKLEELEGAAAMLRMQPSDAVPDLRPLLQPVIRKDAKPEDVEVAAKAVEELAAKNPAARREVGRIANTIIDAGKLSNYGTARAQEFLTKWAKDYGKPGERNDKETKKTKDGEREKESKEKQD